jgi:hypothetical protein
LCKNVVITDGPEMTQWVAKEILLSITTKYYCIGVIKRRIRWAGHVAWMWKARGAYRVLVEEPERKKPLGRLRRRWKDNIKTDVKSVGRALTGLMWLRVRIRGGVL